MSIKKESKQFRPVGSLSGPTLVLFFCFAGHLPLSLSLSLLFLSLPYTPPILSPHKLSIYIFH